MEGNKVVPTHRLLKTRQSTVKWFGMHNYVVLNGNRMFLSLVQYFDTTIKDYYSSQNPRNYKALSRFKQMMNFKLGCLS
jgi:hypothetical protein